MKTIKINSSSEIPENFTGIAEYQNGTKYWIKNDNLHREGGPAIEFSNGIKYWYLEGRRYRQINLKDYVVLDHDKGKCNIMWYRLLDKDKILDYPDIPGLIIKMKAAPKP